MKIQNLLIILSIAFLIMLFSCKKNDSPVSYYRDDYLGFYQGEDTNSMGSWSLAQFSITVSPKGNSYVYIEGLVRHSEYQIEAQVNEKQLIFPEHTFHIDSYSPGGAHTVYDAVYFGSAKLDSNNQVIRFEHTEKQIFKDTTFIIKWITVGKK